MPAGPGGLGFKKKNHSRQELRLLRRIRVLVRDAHRQDVEDTMGSLVRILHGFQNFAPKYKTPNPILSIGNYLVRDFRLLLWHLGLILNVLQVLKNRGAGGINANPNFADMGDDFAYMPQFCKFLLVELQAKPYGAGGAQFTYAYPSWFDLTDFSPTGCYNQIIVYLYMIWGELNQKPPTAMIVNNEPKDPGNSYSDPTNAMVQINGYLSQIQQLLPSKVF
jgi:hypothetical protein